MKFKVTLFCVITALSLVLFNACQKEESILATASEELKILSSDDELKLEKLKLSDRAVARTMADRSLRIEFNKFIRAKLALGVADEHLSLKEVFLAYPVTLNGVNVDFMKTFKSKFINNVLSEANETLQLETESDVRSYFNVRLSPSKVSSKSGDVDLIDDYIIYFPYSEEFDVSLDSYATANAPLTNNVSNVGSVYDDTGNLIENVTIDDDYAFRTPTYISMIDDALSYDEAKAKNIGGSFQSKRVLNCFELDDVYNPYNQSIGYFDCGGGSSGGGSPPQNAIPGTCGNKELRAGGGRWTLLNNGYGLFEGAIEFGYAFSNEVTQVNIPGGSSNNEILITATSQFWSYTKIKRRDVRDMDEDEDEFVSIGWFAGNFCEEEADRMLYLFEYDSNNVAFDAVSSTISSVAGLFPDTSTTYALLQGASALVGLIIPQSNNAEEYFGRLRAETTYVNHDVPSNGTVPTNINGYRLYGNNQVNLYWVYD